jgi:hypothetical protein
MIAQQRGGTLRGGMPNMFSIAYLHQLIDLANEPARLIKTLTLPHRLFSWKKDGWSSCSWLCSSSRLPWFAVTDRTCSNIPTAGSWSTTRISFVICGHLHDFISL